MPPPSPPGGWLERVCASPWRVFRTRVHPPLAGGSDAVERTRRRRKKPTPTVASVPVGVNCLPADPPFAKEALAAYSIFEPYKRDAMQYGRAFAQNQVRMNGRPISGTEIQRNLEKILTTLQTRNETKYEYDSARTGREPAPLVVELV